MLARLLIPDLKHLGEGEFRSSVPGCMTLELSQIEHNRYTSTLLSSRRIEDRRVRDLAEGYRLNRFVGKWLGFCVRQGHSFHLNSARVSDSIDQSTEPRSVS